MLVTIPKGLRLRWTSSAFIRSTANTATIKLMQESNLLKLKSASGKMYVFDALSNNFFSVNNREDYKALKPIDFGCMRETRLNSLEFHDFDKAVTSEAKTLVLEVTNKCNLRCSYCVFDKNSSLDRDHGNQTMSRRIAFKAVYDFYERTNKEEGNIVFIGGEPLLAFELVKEVVKYANEISNFRLKFSMTSNGLLLSDEKFSFFRTNNFLITLSLDGDKNTHDKHRVTHTGMGSFDRVIHVLNSLKDFDKDFFKKNLQINCVILDIDDLDTINNFFKNWDFPEKSLRFSAVTQEGLSINSALLSSVSLDVVVSTDNISAKPVERFFANSIIDRIKYRKLDSEAMTERKICIPFSDRTYIRTDGSVQFCERIGDYGKLAPLASNEKITSKSIAVHNEFKTLKKKSCGSCFAYNFCQMCPASFIINSQLDNTMASNKCEQFRKIVKQALKVYINEKELDL